MQLAVFFQDSNSFKISRYFSLFKIIFCRKSAVEEFCLWVLRFCQVVVSQ